jgi:D-3-phosphoglycerate dehydrogenase
MVADGKRLVSFDRWYERWSNDSARRHLQGITLIELDHGAPQAELLAEVGQSHGYQISPRTELEGPWLGDRQLIARCPNLIAICTTGSGYDVVDVEACTEAGIIVCNQAGMNKEAVAEHALGMILSLSKKIALTDRLLRRDQKLDRLTVRGDDIRGKTVGIVGLGHIGARLAELCSGLFGMTVLAYDPYLSEETIHSRHAAKVEFDEIFSRSDYVSVHCPRTDETFGMIGRAAFALMKPTAYFVTTARGGVHVEADLVDALASRRIAGAGIDVFMQEPPAADHPLLAFDNVIATPHIAGTTADSIRNMADANALQWAAIFRGEIPPRLINPAVWPRYCERYHSIFGSRPTQLA